jgi:hypothetical protein
MKSLNTLARWIVMSSANPSEVALTIKGGLVFLVPATMALAGVTHINVGQDQLNTLIDGFAAIVQTLLTVVSAVMVFVGMVRKLWITIHTHQAVVTSTDPTTPPAPSQQ